MANDDYFDLQQQHLEDIAMDIVEAEAQILVGKFNTEMRNAESFQPTYFELMSELMKVSDEIKNSILDDRIVTSSLKTKYFALKVALVTINGGGK